MKSIKKKLSLKKKTVFTLTNESLNSVKGGKDKIIDLPSDGPTMAGCTTNCTIAHCETIDGCISLRC